ncbi:unnamed protein product [Caenorhabditis brenneri]
MPATLHFERVGTFKKLADKTAVVGGLPNRLNEDPRLYGELENELDLNRGCEGFRDEGYGDLFYSFFDYIIRASKQGTPLKEVISADFISNRRNLITFAASAFSFKGNQVIRALRKDGVIFLCDRKSENDWINYDGTGYKFEQYMTLKDDGEPHEEDERVSNAECVKSVLRTTVKSGKEEMKVFYAAEIDTMDVNKEFGEIKTTSLSHNDWIEKKGLDHYLQSYLGNVSYIIKGYREGNLVKQVDRIETDSIPDMGGVNWTPERCRDKLFEILREIKNRLREDDKALIITVKGTNVYYRPEFAENCHFVGQQFLEYFH